MSKLNECICGNCKHFKTSDCPFYKAIFEVCEDDTCDNWEDDNEPTEEEQRINAGDIEAHRIMVEGREIV